MARLRYKEVITLGCRLKLQCKADRILEYIILDKHVMLLSVEGIRPSRFVLIINNA